MARKPQENPALDMTPMIDVVFELIIFFVVTIKQEDIFSKLNVNRPAPATGAPNQSDEVTCTIQIQARGSDPNGTILYNSKQVDLGELFVNLREIAKTSKKTPIIVKCTETSPHKALVDVLYRCYQNGLFSVSIFTL